MLTHKKISIKNIISKIYRDLNIKEEDSLVNLIEWIGEALSFIKVPSQLQRISRHEIHICNHRAEIPCDLIYLQSVEFNGSQLNKNPGGRLLEHTGMEYFYNNHYAVNRDKMVNINFINGSSYRFNDIDSFIMENGWFKTSFPEGTIYIDYDKMETDEEGFPLVPDDESFRAALFWYSASKYFYIKFIESSGADTNKFNALRTDAEQKWQWYCGQAGTNALMPDEHTMEIIKKNFISLVPKLNSAKGFYNNLNK